MDLQNRDTFSGYHPLVNFIYFGFVLVFSMFFVHPLSLLLSLVGALAYSIYLNGRKALHFALLFVLPMALAAALLNPAFNHEGATILAYLPSGNPLTLESLAYGSVAAVRLAAVILWFSCYNVVITSDKFVYLFGRIIPALSLVLSMALRFVPKFKAQLKVVTNAQCCIGRDIREGSNLQRVQKGITIFSIMVTWALENAIETADSMKSRGYGLPNRTAFSIYSFSGRDKTALLWLLCCGFYVGAGCLAGALSFHFYPTMAGAEFTLFSLSFQLVYLLLCVTPVALDLWAERQWQRLAREKTV